MRPRAAAAALALLLCSGCTVRTVVHTSQMPHADAQPQPTAPVVGYQEQTAWYGSAALLDSPTILYSVYLNEQGGAVWTEQAIAQTRQSLTVAVDWLGEQAALWDAQEFALYCDDSLMTTLTVNHRFNGGDEGDDFHTQLDDLCLQLDTADLHEAYGTDHIAFLFFLPVAGASYTLPHYAEDGMWYTYEYSLLYAEDIYSDPGTAESPAVYAHEILHLFGAPDLYEDSSDYYVTDELVDYVATMWPDAIMYDTYNTAGDIDYACIDKEICPLTAFRLGLCDRFEGLERFPAVAELPAGVFGTDGNAMQALPVSEAV